MMENSIFNNYTRIFNFIILIFIFLVSLLLDSENFYISDYIKDGDVYKLSDLQGDIEGGAIIIKLFFILNNFSIFFIVFNKKTIGIIFFICIFYLTSKMVEINLFLNIIFSSMKFNIELILIFFLYSFLLLINVYLKLNKK
ncbi:MULTISPECIES: transcriptional regulator [unclassified Neisseria]|uniref:transcriptional regulator n=1 Tax=unclassified Neisseria TaxID=2623750 RepID=UPI003F81F526